VALKRKLIVVIVVVLIVIVRIWRVTVGSDYGSQSIAVKMLLMLRIVQGFHTSSSVAWRHWKAYHSAFKSPRALSSQSLTARPSPLPPSRPKQQNFNDRAHVKLRSSSSR
jgi:hypothetical protein